MKTTVRLILSLVLALGVSVRADADTWTYTVYFSCICNVNFPIPNTGTIPLGQAFPVGTKMAYPTMMQFVSEGGDDFWDDADAAADQHCATLALQIPGATDCNEHSNPANAGYHPAPLPLPQSFGPVAAAPVAPVATVVSMPVASAPANPASAVSAPVNASPVPAPTAYSGPQGSMRH